jgi:tRNA pseudouridine38-40 synthase
VSRFLLRIAYDGTGYVGWQRQINGISLQERIEEAAGSLAGTAVVVFGAGRTDAGVHAMGQAAHVDLPDGLQAETVRQALNSRLPADIRVRHVAAVPGDFHARFSAIGKTYRYRWLLSHTGVPLLERDAWRVTPGLDLTAMRDAARRLVGLHDFAGFQSTGTAVRSTTRHLTDVALLDGRQTEAGPGPAGLDAGETLVDLVISGNGFLRHMVRAMAGTLTDIGRGRWAPSRMDEILAGRDRTLAGPTAPAHGLTLWRVEYPDLMQAPGPPPSAAFSAADC